MDTGIQAGAANVVYSDLEHCSSSTQADTSNIKNDDSSSVYTNNSPFDLTNGEIVNGHTEPLH